MLPLSVTFKSSNDYVRLTLLIHAFVMVALLRSALPMPMIIGVLILLAFPLFSILRFKNPLVDYEKLFYQSGAWFLRFANGDEKRYRNAEIAFDGGLFILLKLGSIDKLSKNTKRSWLRRGVQKVLNKKSNDFSASVIVSSERESDTHASASDIQQVDTSHDGPCSVISGASELGSKKLVIFKDQMSTAEFRALKFCILQKK